jgi:hypothetical protein
VHVAGREPVAAAGQLGPDVRRLETKDQPVEKRFTFRRDLPVLRGRFCTFKGNKLRLWGFWAHLKPFLECLVCR